MKKIYLLLLMAIVFSFNQINAQCPDGAFVVGSPSDQQIIFTFDDGGSAQDCSSRPDGIFANIGNDSAYVKGFCDTNYVVYDWIIGPGVADINNFTVLYDGLSCTYTGNLLPIGKFEFLTATLRVYPNPVKMNDNHLNVKFITNVTAKIYIYDVTGKLALMDEMNNVRRKEISTSNLTNGVYFLKIVTDDTTLTKKVIIMK